MKTLSMCVQLGLVLSVGCHPPQAAVDVRNLLEQGELDRAQQKVDQAVESHPKDPTLRRISIEVHLRRDDRAGAIKSYRSWLDQRGKDRAMLNHFALSVLRWGLSSRDPKTRLAALQGARQTDADQLEADVADRLEDPDEMVRTWAAVALSGTPAGAEMLSRQLRSTNAKARAVAVANLARIAKMSAFSSLKQFVSDPSAEVRAALARGLGGLHDGKVVVPLKQLARDKDRNVRTAAITALGNARRKAALATVRSALKDSYLGVRVAAVLALADLKGEGAKAGLRELANGPDLTTALRAGVRLARLGEDQPALNAIAKGLVDRNWTIRAAACNAATSLGRHRVALKLIQKALRDPEPRVRAAAARAALAQGDKVAAARTGGLLRGLACAAKGTDMEALCLQAGEILIRAGNRAGLKTLQQLAIKGTQAAHRREALRLALTGGALLALAVDALADENTGVAISAAVQIFKKTEE